MTVLALFLALAPQAPSSQPSARTAEIRRLVARLDDAALGVEERVAIARKVGRYGAYALPELARFLARSDSEKAVVALEGVKLVGAPAVRLLPELRAYLRSANVQLCGQSLEILGKLGPAARAALPEVAALYRCSDAQVRRLALVVADRLGLRSDRLAPALRVALLDEDALVREAARVLAARHLGAPVPKHGRVAARRLDELVALFVEDARARRLAAVALRARGEAALPAFDRLLAAVSEHRELAIWAPVALSGGGKPGLARLVARLESGDGPAEVWLAAIAEMGRAARSATGAVRGALVSPDEAIRVAAASALARVGGGDEATIAALCELVDVRSPAERVAAIAALGALGGDSPRAVRRLVAAVGDADRRARWAAVEALGRLREPSAVGALRAALASRDEHLRWRAVRALGRIGPRASAALPDLRALGEDPSRWVREVLAEAIRDIGG